MIKKEYGGYLPLEAKSGDDFFSKYGNEHVVRTNSAKAAIYLAIQQMKLKKVYVPYYMCDSVLHMLKGMGIDIKQYWLTDELLPNLKEKEADAGILLVNYFGVMDIKICEEVLKYTNVIIDHSHAFFCPPILREDVCNIYSCRKFVGVPDGGYLVSKRALCVDLEPDKVSKHFSYLAISAEFGMNEVYAEKMESDRYFYDNYKGMSLLSQSLLSSVAYEQIEKKRKENFGVLNRLLKAHNRFSFDENLIASYLYPFWPKENKLGAEALKKALVSKKIYTPTLWRGLIFPQWEDTIEYQISKETIFLPVDQRYDSEDMEYLANTVLSLCGTEEK